MKIYEIPEKIWKIKRANLANGISDSEILGGFTIKRSKIGNYVEISGAQIPIVFNCDKQELFVHSRCSRYAGSAISASDLIELQYICSNWYYSEISEGAI